MSYRRSNKTFQKCLALAAVAVGLSIPTAETAIADNPSESRLSFSVSRTNISRNGIETLVFRVLHRFSSGQEVDAGGSCTVELSACLNKFIPEGETEDAERSCKPVVIGSKTMEPGDSNVRFTLLSKPAKSSSALARQVSFQTRATCTDSVSASAVVTSNPRAKKVSRIDGRGVVAGKFFRLLQNSLR